MRILDAPRRLVLFALPLFLAVPAQARLTNQGTRGCTKEHCYALKNLGQGKLAIYEDGKQIMVSPYLMGILVHDDTLIVHLRGEQNATSQSIIQARGPGGKWLNLYRADSYDEEGRVRNMYSDGKTLYLLTEHGKIFSRNQKILASKFDWLSKEPARGYWTVRNAPGAAVLSEKGGAVLVHDEAGAIHSLNEAPVEKVDLAR